MGETHVSHWTVIIDDKPNRLVGAEIVDVPFRVKRIGVIAFEGFQENGSVVVRTKALTVHPPQSIPREILVEINLNNLSCDIFCTCWDLVRRNCLLQRLLI